METVNNEIGELLELLDFRGFEICLFKADESRQETVQEIYSQLADELLLGLIEIIKGSEPENDAISKFLKQNSTAITLTVRSALGKICVRKSPGEPGIEVVYIKAY